MMNLSLKQNWELDENGLNRLLDALDPDPSVSPSRYEDLRERLIRYCNWRGSLWAESDADTTLDRVALRLMDTHVSDVHRYAFGVARYVVNESLRAQRKEQATESLDMVAEPQDEDLHAELRWQCFEECLGELPDEKRLLLLSYYRGDQQAKISNRREMALKLGISVSCLRLQVHRIRAKLETSVKRRVRSERSRRSQQLAEQVTVEMG